jgi:hypothetical protein
MTGKEILITGKWSPGSLEELIMTGSGIPGAGERIAFLSSQFLGIPYQDSTLVGGMDTEEVFTINLGGVDCFTLIDYIEAMRLSSSFAAFRENLKKVRYQKGIISFEKRNHFFSDWAEYNAGSVGDISEQICPGKTRSVKKHLNLKDDGLFFVPGIRPVQRELKYIPAAAIDDSVLDRLMTGDYIGIYSDLKGLDVSHVGIFIREGNAVRLRHAAAGAESRRVLDQDFIEYVSSKPGIMVLRPKDKKAVRSE